MSVMITGVTSLQNNAGHEGSDALACLFLCLFCCISLNKGIRGNTLRAG